MTRLRRTVLDAAGVFTSPDDELSAAEATTCLVAVDGSQASVQALVWCLRHASDHAVNVEVLTVWPAHDSVLVHEVPGHFCAPRWSARAAQQDAVRHAIDQVPGGPIPAITLENADVASAIVRASARHDLVVLGSDPSDDHHRLTDRIIEDAACEVVVVGASNARWPAALCSRTGRSASDDESFDTAPVGPTRGGMGRGTVSGPSRG